jgi:hypothetical protein
MKRRECVRNTSIAGTGLFFTKYLGATNLFRYLPEGNFHTLERYIKDSGLWFKEFLKE